MKRVNNFKYALSQVPNPQLTIGDLAERTGIATSALRYYDELDLLRPATRVSGQRRYDWASVAVVGVIRMLKEVGFTLSEIRTIIAGRALAPTDWRDVATRKLREINDRIAKAEMAKLAIEHTLACPHDNPLECPNFWRTVGGILEGKSMAEAHTD
jgi:DNA-binding transcriptional MerR regulator